MQIEAKKMLFDIAKGQDMLMHTISAELGVKTSLYLVFSVFLFNATLQISEFAKDQPTIWSYRSIVFSTIGATLSLLSATTLLIAPLVRKYQLFPVGKMARWIEQLSEFKQQYPEEELPEAEDGIRETFEETIAANKSANERKAFWITLGAFLLFIAVPFVALAGIFAFFAYLS